MAALAPRYHSAALGDLEVVRRGRETVFDFGGWQGRVASRKNSDGGTTFAVTEPGIFGFELTVTEHDGRRALLVSDRQHEYLFVEMPAAGAAP